MDQRLVDYIWGNVQQGYPLDSIRTVLLSQGYAQQQVDEAVSYVQTYTTQGSTVKRRIPINKTFMIFAAGIVALVLLVVAAGFVLFGGEDTVDQPPASKPPNNDVSTKPSTTRNSTDAQTTTRPNTNQNTRSNTTNNEGKPPQSLSPPVNSGSLPESKFEIDKKVDELAADYPEDAAKLCLKLQTQNGKDACYSEIAIKSKKVEYCTSVVAPKSKDGCYIQFAIQGIGDTSVCDNIVQDYLISSCRSLYSYNYNSGLQQDYLASTTSNEFA